MNAPTQADDHRNEQRRARLQAMSLTAWDLRRSRSLEGHGPRARVMTLRTDEKLRFLSEAELGVPKYKRSFLKVGDEGAPGVLLIHDTDQTPANLVPLARSLHGAGLTVHGLLLADDGHGATSRPEARWRATLQHVHQGLQLLTDCCSEVCVVGVGFGAALAIHVASRSSVAGLVLLAPALVPRVGLGIRLLQGLRLLKLPPVRRRLGLAVDVIEGQQSAGDLVGKIDVPIFGAMCDDDTVASPDALRLLQKRAHHRRCRFLAFPKGGHDVLAAHGTSELDRDIIEFVRDKA